MRLMGIIFFGVAALFSAEMYAKESDNTVCDKFHNKIVALGVYDKNVPFYCDSTKQYKSWIMGESFNYARVQSYFVAARLSIKSPYDENIKEESYLVILYDANLYMSLWLMSGDYLLPVHGGFEIDGSPVYLYDNDQVSQEFLSKLAGAGSISLNAYRLPYAVPSDGASAAIRYLIQGSPQTHTPWFTN